MDYVKNSYFNIPYINISNYEIGKEIKMFTKKFMKNECFIPMEINDNTLIVCMGFPNEKLLIKLEKQTNMNIGVFKSDKEKILDLIKNYQSKKGEIKMKKTTLTIMAIFILANYAFAGGVTDNNNGTKGDLLIHSGVNHGANSIGTWTDSSKFKGEKGDTGVKGVDGEKGDTGVKGVDGEKGERGAKGGRGQRGKQGKGLKNRQEVQIEGVIKETKRTSWSIYFIHDFNNDINTVGAKVKVYIGQSYSDQVREELEKRLDMLEKVAPKVNLMKENNMKVVPTKTGFKIQKDI